MRDLELLRKEVEQILGGKSLLGSPIEEGQVYDIWVRFKYAPLDWGAYVTWMHRAAYAKYCRVDKEEDGRWIYNFEDGDETLAWPLSMVFPYDKDFNEVILTVDELAENKIRITFSAYDSKATRIDIGIGSEVLWENVGGKDRIGLGEKKIVERPPVVTITEPPSLPWWKKIPWWVWPTTIGGGLGALYLVILRKVK